MTVQPPRSLLLTASSLIAFLAVLEIRPTVSNYLGRTDIAYDPDVGLLLASTSIGQVSRVQDMPLRILSPSWLQTDC